MPDKKFTFPNLQKYTDTIQIINSAIILFGIALFSIDAHAQGIVYARAAQEEQNNGNLEKAIEYYSAALDEGDLSNKHQAYVLNNRGILLQDLNNSEEAENDYKAAVRLLPDYSDAYYNLVTLFLSQKRYDDALGILNDALIAIPESADLLLKRGVLYREMKEVEAALQDVSQAILIKPSLGSELIDKSNVYLGSYIEIATIDHFITILSEEPSSLDGYLKRAKAYLSTGFFEQALFDVKYVIELEPKSFNAYEAKAIILYSQGAFDKSIRAFDNALQFSPNNAEIFYNRGNLYKSLGDNNNASFDYQMAFRINRKEKKYRKELKELGLIK